jgi:hypothetical protein
MTESRTPAAPGSEPEADEEPRESAQLRRAKGELPVVNDQEPTGQQGTSSDRPGVDPGGYPEQSRLRADDDGSAST